MTKNKRYQKSYRKLGEYQIGNKKHLLKPEKNWNTLIYIRMRDREKLLIYETKHVWESFHNFANRTKDENQSNNLIKYKL